MKDIINLCRMVGARFSLGSEGREFEQDGMRAISEAKTALSAGDKQVIRERHEKDLRGMDVSHLPDYGQSVSAASYQFVKAIQERLEGQLIRRTVDSRKPDGSKINDKLPPLVRHILPVVLPESEMHQLRGELTKHTDEYVGCYCPLLLLMPITLHQATRQL